MIDWNIYKDWIFINLFNIISVDWEKRKTIKQIKGIFNPLKWYFKFYWKYCPFYRCIHRGKLLSIISTDVDWKDKYETPRLEECPFVSIRLFNCLLFNWAYKSEENSLSWNDDYDYWEQVLWYLYYASYNKEKKGYDKLDINKARETWPWRGENNKSTWDDKYLVKSCV